MKSKPLQSGRVAHFNSTMDIVLFNVKIILSEQSITIKTDELTAENGRLIIGDTGMGLTSSGEVVKIYIVEQSPNSIAIFVDSVPKVATQWLAPDHAPAITQKLYKRIR
ncbi:MAG: hypothetical protein ACRC6B_10105 [Fusobacteriaceae bacterium]